MQWAAVSTLPVYASCCRLFCVVAPPADHADAKDADGAPRRCSLMSYQRRGWCRLEQLARMSMGSVHNMFVFEDAASGLVSYSEIPEETLEHYMQVTPTYRVPRECLSKPDCRVKPKPSASRVKPECQPECHLSEARVPPECHPSAIS